MCEVGSYIVGQTFEKQQRRKPEVRAFDLGCSLYVLGKKRS